MGVPTFGYLRIVAYLQLPVAYRSLSRLSSAPDAKAFSLCSCLLELLLMYPFKDTVITCSLYQELLSYIKQFVFGFFTRHFTQLLVWLNCIFLPLI